MPSCLRVELARFGSDSVSVDSLSVRNSKSQIPQEGLLRGMETGGLQLFEMLKPQALKPQKPRAMNHYRGLNIWERTGDTTTAYPDIYITCKMFSP